MSGAIDHYWSSSPVADGGSPAWGVIFGFGRVYGGDTDCSHSDDVGPDGYARCVRP
jgi:hypothetical protein